MVTDIFGGEDGSHRGLEEWEEPGLYFQLHFPEEF